ncbi:hypothetical protein FRB96_000656 [Tulasnella sp. 330]|nr:hypothetical protein FRB96_000656 [Tulasnella sp. 330]
MSSEFQEKKNGAAVYAKDTSSGEHFESGEKLPEAHGPLHRQLKNRHVAMISMAGVIGVGIFVNTATALRNGGPVGLILGFMTMGVVCWSVMVSLGEMVSYLPIPGGHIRLAERFGNKALAFAMGWNYWYNWVIVLPAELSAAAILIDYWGKHIDALWISICLIVVVGINLMGAGFYGESEFMFGSIKILTIIGLVILGIIIDLGGGPTHDRLGFRYWKEPGPFVQYAGIEGAKGRFLGYWSVLTTAAFSFIGTEIVAIAAGEAKNPRRNVPRAIKRVYVRIVFFYLTSVVIISVLVASNNPWLNLKEKTASASPFVIGIKEAGIKGLPGFVNAWSAASSDLYTSSRALYGLALTGNAPRIFTKTSKNGLPYVSVFFCAIFCTLAYMSVSSGGGKVFGWFANLTAICGLITWTGICFTYLRFHAGMKAQGFDRKTLPFASRFQPFAAYFGFFSTIIICFFSGWAAFLPGNWDTATFVTNYLPLVTFPIIYTGARLYFKTGLVAPKDMDFISGIAEIEADETEEPVPKNRIEAFWGKLTNTPLPPQVAISSRCLAITDPFVQADIILQAMVATLDLTDAHDSSSRKTLSGLSLAVVKARRIVIVTGAGISCSCGIPDFRSTDGLYNLVKSQYPNAVVKGRDLFDSSLFRDATSTGIFYTFISGLKAAIDQAEPSPTHHFIKTLETKGKLLRSYTQNIDGLEERVGLVGTTSEAALKGGKGKGKLKVDEVKNVLLHGDIHRVRCTLCSATSVCIEEHMAIFEKGQAPDCEDCLRRSDARVARSARPLAIGKLRPAIVLYDEPHPLGDDIGAIETKDLNRRPDLLIIMGTSLKVHGLRKLVKEFASTVHTLPSSSTSSPPKAPPNRGFLNKVIFVNKTAPSSEWNGIIDYHVQGQTDDWVARVIDDWKKARPADWELQTTLLEGSKMKIVKDLSVSGKIKAIKKKVVRKEVENVDPSSLSSQASQKTLVDTRSQAILPYTSTAISRQNKLAAKSISLPQLAFASNKPAPLSPSKRGNRTYTTAEARKAPVFAPSSTSPPLRRGYSSSSSLTEFDDIDIECQSDTEAPIYDSESERSSPRKKRRSPTSQDMSIDEIVPPPLQDIRPTRLFSGAVGMAAKGTFTSRLTTKYATIILLAPEGIGSNTAQAKLGVLFFFTSWALRVSGQEPPAYLSQLQSYLQQLPLDTNFSVVLQPSKEYGTAFCGESGCLGTQIALGKDEHAADGGKQMGFGSLKEYQPPQTRKLPLPPPSPLTSKLRVTGTGSPFSSTQQHRGIITNENARPGSSSSSMSVPTKRLSIDGASSQPFKRVKVESSTTSPSLRSVFSQRTNIFGRSSSNSGPPPANALKPSPYSPPTRAVEPFPIQLEHIDRFPFVDSECAYGQLETLRSGLCTMEIDLAHLNAGISTPEQPTTYSMRLDFPSLETQIRTTEKSVEEQETPVGLAPESVKDELKTEHTQFRLPGPSSHALIAEYSRAPVELEAALSAHMSPTIEGEYSFAPNDFPAELDMDQLPCVDVTKLPPVHHHVDAAKQVPINSIQWGRKLMARHSLDSIGTFINAHANAEFFQDEITVTDALKYLQLPSLETRFPDMKVTLCAHQVLGVAWMVEQEAGINKGGILADEMGLGKTIQMMAMMTHNRPKAQAPSLIIGPVALLFQWEEEILTKTTWKPKVLIYHGQSRPKGDDAPVTLATYDFILTSYGTIAAEWPGNEDFLAKAAKRSAKSKRKDGFIEHDSEEEGGKKQKGKKKAPVTGPLFKVQFHRIVLDEAQNIRNRSTKISQAVEDLIATYRWCLTGTPITNSTVDAYGLLRFLRIRPWLERKNPTLMTRRLQSIFKVCLLRRKKDSMLDGKKLIELPLKTSYLQQMEFSLEEGEIYNFLQARSRAIFNKYLRQGTVLKNYAHVLVLLLRLRQCCVHPSLIAEFEDAFLKDGEVRDSGEDANLANEIMRARSKMGDMWVDDVKDAFKRIVLERMEEEKNSPDDAAVSDECPICFELMTEPVVTRCKHVYCRTCIDNVFEAPLLEDVQHNHQDRTCPSCRGLMSREEVFAREAFMPTDTDLGLAPEPEKVPAVTSSSEAKGECNGSATDDGSIETSSNEDLKLSRKLSRESSRVTTRAKYDEDSDDSMNDFIAEDGESGSEKDQARDARKKKGKKGKGKMRIQPSSDDEDFEGSQAEEDNANDEENGLPEENHFYLAAAGVKEWTRKPSSMTKFVPSTKMHRMMELLEIIRRDNPSDKVLVISQWTSALELVGHYLQEKGFTFVTYDGSMTTGQRQVAVRALMTEDKVTVMLMSLKAGGVGLNLVRANHVISLDFAWSEAVEAQAFDRCHRLGQEKPVSVHRLAIANSVEAKVIGLQEKKKLLADGSLGEGSAKLGRLSVKDLANLFGLDAQGRVID